MFEKALITRVGEGTGIDIGLLAETVFLYQSTQLLLGAGSIVNLAKSIPHQDLLSFLDRAPVKLSYLRPNFAVHSEGTIQRHKVIAFTFMGDRPNQKLKNWEELEIMLRRSMGTSSDARRLARDLGDRFKPYKFDNKKHGENIIPRLASADISDAAFVKTAVSETLASLLPNVALPPWRFRLIDVGDGFLVDTDLDFAELNRAYHKSVPPSQGSITPAFLLAHFVTSRAISFFAADYMAEAVVAPLDAALIRIKHFDFLRRRDASVAEHDLFKSVAADNFPSIREAINSGDRSMSDFLRLLDKADRFKEWLGDINPDEGLVRSYIKRTTEDTWAEKLPTKATRFTIATGLGVAIEAVAPSGLGLAAGITLAAADQFYLDKLIKGWRPNQFIEGPLREFTRETR